MERYCVKVVDGHSTRRGFVHSQLDFIDYVLSALDDCGLDFHRNFKIEFQQNCGANNWRVYVDGELVADYSNNILTLGVIAVVGGKWDKIVNHPAFSAIQQQ